MTGGGSSSSDIMEQHPTSAPSKQEQQQEEEGQQQEEEQQEQQSSSVWSRQQEADAISFAMQTCENRLVGTGGRQGLSPMEQRTNLLQRAAAGKSTRVVNLTRGQFVSTTTLANVDENAVTDAAAFPSISTGVNLAQTADDEDGSVHTYEDDDELDLSRVGDPNVAGKDDSDKLAKKELLKVIAPKQEKMFQWMRLVSIIVFFVTGIVASLAAYFINSNNNARIAESATATANLNLSVTAIEDRIHCRSSDLINAIRSVSDQITLYSLDSRAREVGNAGSNGNEEDSTFVEGTFPFVTLPHFSYMAHEARRPGTAPMIEQLLYAPVVEGGKDDKKWIEYSTSQLQSSSRSGGKGDGDAGDNRRTTVAWNDEVTIADYFTPYIFDRVDASSLSSLNGTAETAAVGPGPFLPLWQSSPPVEPSLVNLNLLSIPVIRTLFDDMTKNTGNDAKAVLSDVVTGENLGGLEEKGSAVAPKSILIQPVYSSIVEGSDTLSPPPSVVGVLIAVVSWDEFFAKVIPPATKGDGVLTSDALLLISASERRRFKFGNTDNNAPTDAERAGPLMPYNDKMPANTTSVSITIFDEEAAANVVDGNNQTFSVHVIVESTVVNEFDEDNLSTVPTTFAVVIAACFLFVITFFFLYDSYVRERNDKVVDSALRSRKLVMSLFPHNVGERLLSESATLNRKELNKVRRRSKHSSLGPDLDAMNHLEEGATTEDGGPPAFDAFKTKPIADLFPNTTILFADLAGFTAWSSTREPAQVFVLLETVYHAFDVIAKKRGVFKVETVGDCYVAVAGLPEPRDDHAIVMCRFAWDCMRKMDELAKKLEVTLGPDTADLTMRMGLHSGPITGGVIRGERSRFQLFGDTMNTASRVESTGCKGRIQLSQDTANLLFEHGKSKWIKPREEKVYAKGKGEMQTYWLKLGRTHSKTTSAQRRSCRRLGGSESDDSGLESSGDFSISTFDDEPDDLVHDLVSERTSRLIQWNSEVLLRLLKQVIAQRQANGASSPEEIVSWGSIIEGKPIDEVQEVIALPYWDQNGVNVSQWEATNFEINPAVADQLHDYVTNIALMYREDNPFHNFEHCSHVLMSLVKFMSRMTACPEGKADAIMEDHAYGITADPLTQFACAFSALVHDVFHPGVPNAQLVKEGASVAQIYEGKSVAEQQSVDQAWDLLMDDDYQDLREAISSSNEELRRFRQLVVNSVMATDIMDKELKALRDARWERAFLGSSSASTESSRDSVNRKATIVIEHLIQASDVAHTMQHWHIFQKWNERLFFEMYRAFKEGRAEADPSKFWYEGELKFFDFYIIPLAKKLKDCGVFGVSSDEGLDYATKNRQEWEVKGKELVKNMLETFSEQMSRINESAKPRSMTTANGNSIAQSLRLINDNVSPASVHKTFNDLSERAKQVERAQQEMSQAES